MENEKDIAPKTTFWTCESCGNYWEGCIDETVYPDCGSEEIYCIDEEYDF